MHELCLFFLSFLFFALALRSFSASSPISFFGQFIQQQLNKRHIQPKERSKLNVIT